MIPINTAENILKVIIESAKLVFENKIENVVVLKLTNNPYKSFHITFILYNYFPISFIYDMGHFCSYINYGTSKIPIKSDIEWNDNCDFKEYWRKIDKDIQLRIQTKYLSKYYNIFK